MEMDKKKNHWEVGCIIKKGKRHEKKGLQCQDYVYSASCQHYQAVVLADGAGKTDMAYYGAKRAAEVTAGLLTQNFEKFYGMEKEQLKSSLIIHVRSALFCLCRQYGVLLDEVKSTILAVAMDKRDKRCILVHLGDGYIGAKINGEYRIISHPVNGRQSFYTCLTSSFPAIPMIQIRKGKIKGAEAVFLMSDGWKEAGKEEAGILSLYQDYEKGNVQIENYEDDIGMITMSERNDGKKMVSV